MNTYVTPAKAMLKTWIPAFAGMTFVTLYCAPLWAEGAGTTSGLALLKNSGARSSALGEAFVSMRDDITAMDFNPASLTSMESGQMSLQHERGFFEDSFSKAMVGVRGRSSSVLGLSVGNYTSGKTELYDGVNPERTVVAEQDLLASIGYGYRWRSVDLGASVKYLSSNLAESNRGTAMAMDLGFQYQVFRPVRIGVSGPIVQSNLKYASTEEKLSRTYRAGASYSTHLPLATGKLPLLFLFDVPYYAGENTAAIALGAEAQLGPIALRLGSNTRSDIQEFTVGTGFQFQQMNLDYSFGLTNNGNFDAIHKLNFALRFSDFRTRAAVQATELSMRTLERYQNRPRENQLALPLDTTMVRVYEVKEGETLEIIASRWYGSAANWREIYSKNKHLYANPEDIKPGSKILLP